MSETGEKISLDQFIGEAEDGVRARVRNGIDQVTTTAQHLLDNARGQTEISVQLEQLLAVLDPELECADQASRSAVAHEIDALRQDLKQRWISAPSPPLLDEIDERLGAIATGLEAMQTPDTVALRKIARKIDGLAEQAEGFGDIEKRFVGLAIGSAVLFFLGLVLLIFPRSFASTPFLSSMWVTLGCMAAFPAVAVAYAFRALPRSRLDAEVEALNQRHFVPLGGVYFAAGKTPAGVIRVTYAPPEEHTPKVKDPRKEKNRIGPLW